MSDPEIDEMRGPLFVADNLCQTEFRELKITFLWTIRNLGSILSPGYLLKSSTFSAREADHLKFFLHLQDRHNVARDYHHLEILLYVVGITRFQLHAPIKSKISVINGRGEEIKTFQNLTTSETMEGSLIARNSHTVARKALTVGDPPEDKLTVYCEITILAELVTELGNVQEKDNDRLLEGRDTLNSDYGFLLQKPELSDVILVTEGKEFFAHKVILAGRSPVFAAMFTHEMEEKTQNRVEIADLDYDVVEEMLRFIYTGRALRLETVAADLLVAADKYDLKGLIRDCEEELSRNIMVETASELLVLADMHKLKHLREKVIDFIDNHSADVRNTKGWKDMVQSHPQLIIEAFVFKPGHP